MRVWQVGQRMLTGKQENVFSLYISEMWLTYLMYNAVWWAVVAALGMVTYTCVSSLVIR